MEKMRLYPKIPKAVLTVMVFGLPLLPLIFLAGQPFLLQLSLVLVVWSASMAGYLDRVEKDLCGLSKHKAIVAALRKKHEADFKTYLEFVKTSSQPSKN